MKKSLWCVLLLLTLLLSSASKTAVFAQSSVDDAQTLLDSLSTAERVGQLFLVTFQGDDASLSSDMAELILTHKVGSVILRPENNNITGSGNPQNAPSQVANLTNNLQRLSLLGTSLADSEDEALAQDELSDPSQIPLLVTVQQEGNGAPYSTILAGLTEMPSSLAIGATWNPDYARSVGSITGEELAALGINLLIGPSLDVLETPPPLATSNLSSRVFGGNAYWVSQMGQAYTQGVHEGSRSRVAVIAKHFPGSGDSDRSIESEIPTIRKSFEQLQQVELAPFIAVTAGGITNTATVDGLLTTHIRYQGFQGSIRATTAPVSFDPQALLNLLSLPALAEWHRSGGVMVSDSLGVGAVERFYDDTGQEFPYRRVARDAFLAGNDLLYLSDFALGNAPYETQLANMQDTIIWFQELYETDPLFQQRVDEAVLRILQLKLRLYENDFSPENVLVQRERIPSIVNQNEGQVVELSRAAMTLLSPSSTELMERLGSPPAAGEEIVIFTDVQTARQCPTCPSVPLMALDELEARILDSYGPQASSQVSESQISSFSFAELSQFLISPPAPQTAVSPTPPSPTETAVPNNSATVTPTATPPAPQRINAALSNARWIIFALQGPSPTSDTLNRFLAERPDLLREANVIVFAFDAPFYLDTTEVSKLTAYYAAFTHIEAAVDAAARTLFQELQPSGSSPVDIAGAGYSVRRQTEPDPEQVLELFIASASEPNVEIPPPSEEPLEVQVGETLRLKTGLIVDRNGNPVPDGTLVRFLEADRINNLNNIIGEVPTVGGIAQLDYLLARRTEEGEFRITAVSGQAIRSQELDISVPVDEGDAEIVVISPPTSTPTPTNTPSPSPTPTETAVPTNTPVPIVITPEPPEEPLEPSIRIELSELWMLTAMLSGLGLILLLALYLSRQMADLQQRLGLPLWGLMAGLLLYIYFALALPGSSALFMLGNWAGLLTTAIGGLLGILFFLILRRASR